MAHFRGTVNGGGKEMDSNTLVVKKHRERLKKYNLPDDMTISDFDMWRELNRMIIQKEQLGWPCESWKDQRFDIVNKYYRR